MRGTWVIRLLVTGVRLPTSEGWVPVSRAQRGTDFSTKLKLMDLAHQTSREDPLLSSLVGPPSRPTKPHRDPESLE